MSHSHTHAPGEVHNHSHGPPQPQAQPQMVAPAPDPVLQAMIDKDFKPVPLNLVPDNNTAVCKRHSLEKCVDCDVDFVNTNRLAKLLAQNPNLLCPPPPKVISQKLSQAITNTKEEGNTFYKMGLHGQAIGRYTMAANIAIQRAPWEANQFMREELSTVISNRSAAYFESGDYIGALVDAETVIALRRNWSKGHCRKARALIGLEKYEEAKDAVRLGLSFEPMNTELINFLGMIDKATKAVAESKAKARESEKSEKTEERLSPDVAAT